jgi:hypothetical protein
LPPADDIPPTVFDHESEDFKTWAKGWQDKVYSDESVNPDITLGELLLVYFEWMSVHKVLAATCCFPLYTHTRLSHSYACVGD